MSPRNKNAPFAPSIDIATLSINIIADFLPPQSRTYLFTIVFQSFFAGNTDGAGIDDRGLRVRVQLLKQSPRRLGERRSGLSQRHRPASGPAGFGGGSGGFRGRSRVSAASGGDDLRRSAQTATLSYGEATTVRRDLRSPAHFEAESPLLQGEWRIRDLVRFSRFSIPRNSSSDFSSSSADSFPVPDF